MIDGENEERSVIRGEDERDGDACDAAPPRAAAVWGLWWPAGGIALYGGALATWLLLRPAPASVVVGVDIAAQVLAPLLALTLWSDGVPWSRCRGATRASRRPLALVWPRSAALVGAGLLGDALGQVLTLAYSLRGAVPVPSWADAAFLTMYPLYLVAILLLPTDNLAGPSRGRAALDGALVVAAFVTCSWPLVLGPTLLRTHQTLAAALVTAAYPLGDLLLLACLLVRWSHLGDRALRPVLTIFTLALAAVVLADSLTEYQSLHGGYTLGGLVDLGWPPGALLAGLGARTLRRILEARPKPVVAGLPPAWDAARVGRHARPSRIWQALLPYAALPPAGLALAYVWRTPGDSRLASGTVVGAVAVVALVVARQVVALRDNARLYRTLDESQRHLHTVITQTPVILFALDRHSIFRLGEGQGLRVLGQDPDTLTGRSIVDVFRAQPALLAQARRALAGEAHTDTAVVAGRALEVRYTPTRDAAGVVDGVIGVALDVTERARAARQLEESEQRYRSLVDHHPDAVFALDRAGRFTSVNATCAALSGYPVDALLALPSFAPLVVPEDLERAQATVTRTLGGAPGHVELGLRHAAGQRLDLDMTMVPIIVGEGVVGVYGIARDVTAYKQAQEALVYQASHDTLTDLPNRAVLQERLEQAVAVLRNAGQPCALLLLDLDRFKEVNDTAGHAQGDVLLRQVAARLHAALRATGTVARLGGDEFAILLPGGDMDGALAVAGAIRTALEEPVALDTRAVHVTASLGIALGPAHGTDAATLLRRADVAMYVAKRDAVPYAVYAPEHDVDHLDRLALVEDLRHALGVGSLTLHYQPKVDLATGTVCGVEALARWPHPTRGHVAPDVFIPLAEQCGLIGPLTAWVLEVALRQARVWLRAGQPLPVAVNLSGANLRDPHLVETVAELLRRHDVPASLLRLELTESVVMADQAAMRVALAALAALGVGLSIDDFGTGYSSLAYLKRLPVDELKLDKAFVRHMVTDASDEAIVRATVGLAHSLGLRIVAEGVEDEATRVILVRFGCDIAQGYHLSCPLPADDLERWWWGYENKTVTCHGQRPV